MPVLDFKEIPEAHLGGGLQDTFELFARDFFVYCGYEVDEDPSRGADGGKDVLVTERRSGVGGETLVRWLVSCKHKAHSGASVSQNDDSNIRDRIDSNQCDGFIGFYSTLASSGLSDALKGITGKVETQIFDREKIESFLLKSPEGLHLAKRYFPKSLTAWLEDNPKPAKIFATRPTLYCKYCNNNLLEPEPTGIIVLWYQRDPSTGKAHYHEMYWCCKGECDAALSRSTKRTGLIDGWEDIPDVAIPIMFARWLMACLNQLNSGNTYSPDAFNNLKDFILSVYPFISRNATQKEQERIDDLKLIPHYLGGLGY